MTKIKIDFRGCRKPADLHERIADKLDFPAYYGRNLDALYDCLTDISEETHVVLCGLDTVRIHDYVMLLRQVFEDAEQDNHNLHVDFGRKDDPAKSSDGEDDEPSDADYADGEE